MESPEFELPNTKYKIPNTLIHTGRLVPIYPETYGISSKWLRSRIAATLHLVGERQEEFLPDEIRLHHQLMGYTEAVHQIHFPDSAESEQRARHRLAFDEIFKTQLVSAIRKQQWQEEKIAKTLHVSRYTLQVKQFTDSLPFTLTKAQCRAIDEIFNDLGKSHPMNRLLQGDVGCGKTVVAALAMYITHLNGFRSILMAPTEILAEQHYETIKQFVEPHGLSVQLVTSSTKLQNTKYKILNTTCDIVIGTHALLYKNDFKNVGLVVIDEQHRFGVEQRAVLSQKGRSPHLLAMTATPIPRSVALVLYSELDLSVIDEMPVGRKPVKTWVVPEHKREAAYEWMRKQIQSNTVVTPFMASKNKDAINRITTNQAFIICPLIEESEHETMQSVKAATVEFDRLKKKVFPDFKLGLLHGRVPSKEKESILHQFSTGQLAILVATPVVEVGIDIPNATIMMIEASERFGLAQLHQLRGRVGRGTAQSYCLLFSQGDNGVTNKRLKSMERINNGAQLSEIDLAIRGPGQLYGTAQHGRFGFKLASMTDHVLIAGAQTAAARLIEQDPALSGHPSLQEWIKHDTIRDIKPN
ncbi:ATP-dependent DNA helicase RecG [Candidatus Roizmanbacteria bacterium]|nr:ATP-dependent DNA helicase RecG [Candidatus Roizmanbacteria bacterium]